MTFKRLLILGGAALLVAGCSTSSTAPKAQVDAVDAQSDARGPKRKAGSGAGNATSIMVSDSTTCRNWPLPSGFIDTTCIVDR